MTSIRSRNPHLRYIDEHEDADASTSFSWGPPDLQGITPRYGLVLTFQIEDHSDAASGTLADLLVGDSNGLVTTSDYVHLEYDGTSWLENTRGQWNLGYTQTGRPAFGKVWIGGGNYVNEPTNANPVIEATFGTHLGTTSILRGHLTSSLSNITRLRLRGTQASTGFAVLEGWGPITDR